MPPDRGSATAGLTLARELARSLGGDARIHETHVSVVVVAGEQAIKLKKPIRFAFVDQSTPQRRRALSLVGGVASHTSTFPQAG